jgi:E3 ubiquitin-protein ligase RNF5
LSFGIGAFPFGIFATAFNNWGQMGPGAAPGMNFNPQIEEQEFLSKIFLWVAIVFIVWLLLA